MSVDLSATYLDWARRNMALNGIDAGAHAPAHRLVQSDVLRWLGSSSETFDLIFCDPPTFSNSKRADDFDVQRDHVRLLEAAMARLAPDGLLLFSNNYRRFRLDQAALDSFASVTDITTATLDADFARNQKIHRCWELVHRQAGTSHVRPPGNVAGPGPRRQYPDHQSQPISVRIRALDKLILIMEIFSCSYVAPSSL